MQPCLNVLTLYVNSLSGEIRMEMLMSKVGYLIRKKIKKKAQLSNNTLNEIVDLTNFCFNRLITLAYMYR